MVAKAKAGASAPADSYDIHGLKFTVNEDFINSWAAFKMIRKFSDESLDNFEKLDLSLELINVATGLTEDDIVKAVGGDDAKTTDVINLTVEIVQAISPKKS